MRKTNKIIDSNPYNPQCLSETSNIKNRSAKQNFVRGVGHFFATIGGILFSPILGCIKVSDTVHRPSTILHPDRDNTMTALVTGFIFGPIVGLFYGPYDLNRCMDESLRECETKEIYIRNLKLVCNKVAKGNKGLFSELFDIMSGIKQEKVINLFSKESNFLSYFIKNNNISIVSQLLESGVNIKSVIIRGRVPEEMQSLLKAAGATITSPKIREQEMKKMGNAPPSLKDLCRDKVLNVTAEDLKSNALDPKVHKYLDSLIKNKEGEGLLLDIEKFKNGIKIPNGVLDKPMQHSR